MSLITEALDLQAQKKPRAIQVEALPPFSSSGSSRRTMKLLAWVAGLALAVVGGIWQGPALWQSIEKFAGMADGQPVRPSPRTADSEPASPPVPPSAQTQELSRAETKNAVPPKDPAKQPAPAVETAEVPQPLLVPFQATDMDEIAAAAQKLTEKREQLVRNFQIQGVRMQGKESRALIDGNPVGLGEGVGAEGIKLKAIEPSRILFEDPDGTEYIKSY